MWKSPYIQSMRSPFGRYALAGLTTVLDLYPGAAIAYSTRKLRNGYTGPCVRVRRASDDAELDVGFLPTGWLDTPTILAFSGGGAVYVRTWYSQSANSLSDMVMTNSALQPYIVFDNGTLSATSLGYPAVHLAGGRYMSLLDPGKDLFRSVAYGAVATVVERIAVSASMEIFNMSQGAASNNTRANLLLGFPTTSTLTTYCRNADGAVTVAQDTTTFSGELLSLYGDFRYSEGAVQGLVNGVGDGPLYYTAGSTPDTPSMVPARIGVGLQGGQAANVYMTELIVYNTDATSIRSALIANQMAQFGIA